jgi:hypothetical protein
MMVSLLPRISLLPVDEGWSARRPRLYFRKYSSAFLRLLKGPPMEVSLEAVLVDTGSEDNDGRLVLVDGRLVAVLVRLNLEDHGLLRGAWYLECGFGACATGEAAYFVSLEEAADWVRGRLSDMLAEEEQQDRAAGGG